MNIKQIHIFWILILLVSCKNHTATPTEELVPFKNKQGLWGYRDRRSTQPIIPNQFHEARPFLNGLAIVGVDNQGVTYYGAIDSLGNYVIPPTYHSIEFPYGNYLEVRSHKKGLTDLKGNVVLPLTYDNMMIWNDSFAIVQLANRYGYYNLRTKKLLIDCEYDQLDVCEDGFVKVKKQEKYAYYNNQGQAITPFTYDFLGNFSNGFASVQKNEKWGFIDRTGDEKIPPQFWRVREFTDSMAIVEDENGRLGIMNTQGKVVFWGESGTAGMPKPKSGLVLFWNQKFGLVNKEGQVVIPFQYDDLPWFGFEGDYAMVSDLSNIYENGEYRYKENARHALINKQNEIIYPFDTTYSFTVVSDSLICVYDKNTGQCMLVNSQKEVRIPYKYNRIHVYNDDFFLVVKEGLYGLISQQGDEVLPPQYTKIEEFHDGLAKVSDKESKIGYINTMGKLVIPCKYTVRNEFKHGFAVIQDEIKRLGYIDKQGNEYWVTE